MCVREGPCEINSYALRHAIQQHEHSMAECVVKVDDSIINFMSVRK
jgi:hypothetical protein